MKTKSFIIIAFVIVSIIQIAVPSQLIFKYEKILSTGKQYKFKITPVDPSDPLRGKYMAIAFAEDSFKTDNGYSWRYGETVYVLFNINKTDGLVHIANISRKKPHSNVDFVKAKIGIVRKNKVEIKYSFNQYFLEETKAPEAAKLYAKATKDSNNVCYAVVNVIDGNAVISDLILNKKSIMDLKK